MITVQNYKNDKYYSKVLNAFEVILTEGNIVEPIEVFMKIGNLEKGKYEDWRFGRINCLEATISGSLSKCSRILRLIGFIAHDFDMVPSPTVYQKWGKGKKKKLQFTRSGVANIEQAYSKCFVWKKRISYLEWKQNQNKAGIEIPGSSAPCQIPENPSLDVRKNHISRSEIGAPD